VAEPTCRSARHSRSFLSRRSSSHSASAASSGWRQLRARRAGHPRARQLKAAGRLRLAERFPFAQIITAAILVFLAAPLIVLVIFSFNTSPVPGLPLTGFTFHWYSQIVHVEGFGAALRSTATLVAVSVGCGVALAVPAAFMLVRSSRGAARAAVNAAVYGPVAIPGVVIGVAMLTAANFLTVNLGVLVTALAHVLLVCPYIIFVMRARLVEMDIRIEEAARDLGSGPARVFRDITLPLLLTSLIGAGLLAAAVSLDEILVTNFTIGPGATLPVWILGQIRRGLTPGINALAVMILSASLLMVGGTAAILRGNLIAGLRNMR
jgi:ABC-type spermidine/putrescine transport system permease subunit II